MISHPHVHAILPLLCTKRVIFHDPRGIAGREEQSSQSLALRTWYKKILQIRFLRLQDIWNKLIKNHYKIYMKIKLKCIMKNSKCGCFFYIHFLIKLPAWPMDCSLPGSSVPGISQVRILEWLTIPFSRGCFQTRDQTLISCLAGEFLPLCMHQVVPGTAQKLWAAKVNILSAQTWY